MRLKDIVITFGSFVKTPTKRKLIRHAFQLSNKKGLEIGGPSSIFSLKSFFPVYLFSKKIDGVNFSINTIWEGSIKEGYNYEYYKNKKGYQYISEASDLNRIESVKYDFLLSSHCLEHTANPIKALKEWNRVLKINGYIILVLPDKNFTFDAQRPITTFEHLKNDFGNATTETDDTHFNEVISLHNIENDKGVETKQQLIDRTKNNYENPEY